jgi:hypothetical protein
LSQRKKVLLAILDTLLMRETTGTGITNTTANETETKIATIESETAGMTTTIDNLRTGILVTEIPETCATHETREILTIAKGSGTTGIRVTGTSAVLEIFAMLETATHGICVIPAT